MMDLWQLNIFCRVIELKSFSRAGEAIHLSQPTISSHIKDLETHFGVQLVDRLSRQVLPTKAGELLYDYARRLLTLRDETESAMAEFLGEIKGRLTLGGSTIPAGYLLPRLIGDFTALYPQVRVALAVGDTTEMVTRLINGQIELAVVGARSEDPRLNQREMIEDELRVVVPADHPWAQRRQITLADLLTAPFIIREAGSGTLKSLQRILEDHQCTVSDLNIVAEMGSTEAIRQGIKNHVGLSIMSTIAVADDVQAGALNTLTISGINLKRMFYLTTHAQRSASPVCRAFINFVTQGYRPL